MIQTTLLCQVIYMQQINTFLFLRWNFSERENFISDSGKCVIYESNSGKFNLWFIFTSAVVKSKSTRKVYDDHFLLFLYSFSDLVFETAYFIIWFQFRFTLAQPLSWFSPGLILY